MAKKSQSAVEALMEQDAGKTSGKMTTEFLRKQVIRLRELEMQREDLAARLASLDGNIHQLRDVELPAMFDEAQVMQIEIAPSGNQPGFVARKKQWYSASMGKMSDEERRVAFEILHKAGAGDLVKTNVTADFGKGESGAAKKAMAALKKLKVSYAVRETVHPQSLAAWVREQVEEKHRTPPLDKLGVKAGSVVEIKPTKEK